MLIIASLMTVKCAQFVNLLQPAKRAEERKKRDSVSVGAETAASVRISRRELPNDGLTVETPRSMPDTPRVPRLESTDGA